MSLVVAQGISLAYGKKVLLDEADFAVGPHDRIGLVGANGTGKSSLLKILAGAQTGDAGTLTLRRRAKVGYLPQEIAGLPAGTLVDAVLSTVPGRDELSEGIFQIENQLSVTTVEADQLELAQALAELHEEQEHFEARHGRHHAVRILSGLGFSEASLGKPTSTLSGGWRMRAALAGLLLQDPDLLLLDEPTNHLDVPSLTWFDGFMKQSRKAMVLISHDRDFLNRQINRVLSLEVEGLRSYTGDYDSYKRQRAEEVEQLKARSERQMAKRAETEAFIERFGAKATKARQAQSRAKMLAKEEIIEVREERATVHFRFPEVARSGRDVVTVHQLGKRYGENIIYDKLDATLERGQRIAVIGANGAGKTTLLRIIAGELSADAGKVTMGHNVVMGYYAQHHADTLERTSTLYDEVAKVAPTKGQSEIRGVLGAFLFSGDDVEKKIGVLSGGERARVALARLLLVPANLLLMDEPTNHLDLDSSEMLIEALQQYGGTILFVSHNRSFINQLATHVWDVRDHSVAPYAGNLDDYLYHQQQRAKAAGEVAAAERSASEAKSGVSDKERRRQEAEARQRRSSREGPLKKEITEVEGKIAKLEMELKGYEASLADPMLYNDFVRARPIMDAHQAGKDSLTALYERWEGAQAKLEAVQSDG